MTITKKRQNKKVNPDTPKLTTLEGFTSHSITKV